ncbi:MAG TPA: glucoamylase family protein [Pseudonocardiaceae bacterium]|nr:glucoamylase family protein [Pseudonocardiaceae bacterium]
MKVGVRVVGTFLLVIAVMMTGCSAAGKPARHARAGAATPQATDPWSQLAADNTLIKDPTTQLSAADLAFLRQVGNRTWNFLSGPDLDPGTGLPMDSVAVAGAGAATRLQPVAAATEFTNPTLIGNYLTAIVAAKDAGVATAAQTLTAASTELTELNKLATYQGFLFRWYDTKTGQAIDSPRGNPVTNGYVSTVDNGWYAQGLLVAEQAFPTLAAGFGKLLTAMQWQFLYDSKDNVLYNGYQVGKGYSNSTYDNAYSGPRIADYLAIGSGKVPGALWWGLSRTPPPTKRQRQVPQGSQVSYTDPQNRKAYSVYEGHYVYDHIKFVPTFNGSMYQALAPNLVVPEQTMAPNSVGLNDRNTALAQGAYGSYGAKSALWGWAPATSPTGRYVNYGAPDLSSDTGAISAEVASPYSEFLALPVITAQAYSEIGQLKTSYPKSYTQYGFLDSIDLKTGQIANRYMAMSQLAIMMAIDDAVDHDQLQTYVANSPEGKVLNQYLSVEQYSIQGLG